MMSRMSLVTIIAWATIAVVSPVVAWAQEDDEPVRILLLAQSPDGHPESTHEYVAGQTLLKEMLLRVDRVSVELVNADSPWPEGPELLRKADVVVLFVSEGAKWLCEDERRYQAFAELADREGGLVGLHWAVGTREAVNIGPFVKLLGACHGGPDRKHAVFETKLEPATPAHPIAEGIDGLDVREEFYYALKTVEPAEDVVPVMTAAIDGSDEMVAWAWTRPDGGRSFGFTGLHFHENWQHEAYRRLVVQAVLWTAKLDPPESGVDVSLDER